MIVTRPPKKIRLGFSQAGAGCTSKQMAPVPKHTSAPEPVTRVVERSVVFCLPEFFTRRSELDEYALAHHCQIAAVDTLYAGFPVNRESAPRVATLPASITCFLINPLIAMKTSLSSDDEVTQVTLFLRDTVNRNKFEQMDKAQTKTAHPFCQTPDVW